MNDDILEIHEVYSEDGVYPILEMKQNLVRTLKPKEIEGYVDKGYKNKERSHKLMLDDGFKVTRETEEYIYYRKKG